MVSTKRDQLLLSATEHQSIFKVFIGLIQLIPFRLTVSTGNAKLIKRFVRISQGVNLPKGFVSCLACLYPYIKFCYYWTLLFLSKRFQFRMLKSPQNFANWIHPSTDFNNNPFPEALTCKRTVVEFFCSRRGRVSIAFLCFPRSGIPVCSQEVNDAKISNDSIVNHISGFASKKTSSIMRQSPDLP